MNQSPVISRSAPPERTAAEQLATPVQFLKGVGPDRAKLLERLGLRTAADVLFNFPRDYQDLTDLRIASISWKKTSCKACAARSRKSILRNTGMGRRSSACWCAQGQRYLRALWFNMPFMADKFRRGQEVLLSGKPRAQRRPLGNVASARAMDRCRRRRCKLADGELLPVYPLTDGLKQAGHAAHRTAGGRSVRRSGRRAISGSVSCGASTCCRSRKALREIHFPTSKENLQQARRRFIYQEMLILQLAMALQAQSARNATASAAAGSDGENRRPNYAAVSVRADGGTAEGDRRNCRRHGPTDADESAAARRRRLRQNGGGGVCDAAGRGPRLPGGADGADRSAGPAAFADARQIVGQQPGANGTVERQPDGSRSAKKR